MTNCPTCSGKGKIENSDFDKRDNFMRHRFDDAVMQYIRSNPVFRRESCFYCVEKHIGSAMQYQREMMTAINSGTLSKQAEINIYQNFLSIVGELNLAAEESEQWEELHTMIKASERTLRYDHILPNWNVLMTEMLKVKTETQKRGLEFKENK
jgi:hypothetical protein